jgi:ribose/xylose/arabinose/galactoside ABC-type transport system permease subunit/ABC-type branched-subunit amino acid transport system ATPase component
MPRRSSRLGGDSRRLGLALIAVALVFFFEWRAGGFIEVGTFKTILLNSSTVLIVGITTGALLISGNVDLSIGGMFALTCVVTAVVARDTHDPVLAIVVGLALGLVLGLANGLLVRLLSISPLIVTLAMLFIYRGLAYVVAGGGTIFGLPESFTNFGRAYPLGLALPVWVALAFFVAVGFVLMRTVAGMRTFAIGGSREAARLNGVNADRHVLGLYALNGLAVGLIGVLTTSQIGSASGNIGLGFEFDVLTAVILGGVAFAGGTGLPIGIFIGVVTIAILNAGMIFMGLQDFYQQITKGVVLLLALGADQVVARRRVRVRDDETHTEESRLEEAGIDTRFNGVHPRTDDRQIGEVVFSCSQLSKRYEGVRAVRGVGFDVRRGEIVCLLGDNGAGKSTVIKMITGVVRPDEGAFRLHGEPFEIGNPADARRAGIETVYQDLALCPNLGAALNLVVGAEPRRGRLGQLSLLDFDGFEEAAKKRLGRLGIELEDYFRPVGSLSGGQRQSVAIARVAHDNVALAILDEPTAALGVTQSRRTIDLIQNLAAHGVGVVLITHDVDTVMAVADRIVVLHLGQVLYEGTIETVTLSDLIHLMAGIRPHTSATPPAGNQDNGTAGAALGSQARGPSPIGSTPRL